MSLTLKDKEIITALSIGDGYLDPKGRLQVEHCERQQEYVIFKAKLLHSVTGGSDIKVERCDRVRSKRKDGLQWLTDDFVTYRFRKQSKSFIEIRELLYPNDKKYFSIDVLNLLTPLGIAIWWMDDGCLYNQKRKDGSAGSWKLEFNTYTSPEESEVIKQYFEEKYGMEWHISYASEKNGLTILRCGMKEGRKFLEIIRDYVNKVPCMSYKAINI